MAESPPIHQKTPPAASAPAASAPAASAPAASAPAASAPAAGKVDLLAHNDGDVVAVAVRDIDAGTRASVSYLDSGRQSWLEVHQPIPLGHKVSLTELDKGAPVIEYGEQVGLARGPIHAGEWVHTHNIRSAKWQLTA